MTPDTRHPCLSAVRSQEGVASHTVTAELRRQCEQRWRSSYRLERPAAHHLLGRAQDARGVPGAAQDQEGAEFLQRLALPQTLEADRGTVHQVAARGEHEEAKQVEDLDRDGLCKSLVKRTWGGEGFEGSCSSFSVDLSRRSRKRGYKNAPHPYRDVWNDEKEFWS